MAVTYRTSVVGGGTSSTGNRQVSITPVVGDLFVVFVAVAGNTQSSPTMSDNNGGTYSLIACLASTISAVNYRTSVFVRDQLLPNTTFTTITATTGSNTSGAIHAYAVAGMTRTGASAVRNSTQFGTQANQAAGGTPAPVLPASALTGNMTLGCVANGTNPATMTPPTSWTEPAANDTGYASDTVGLESVYRNSGFTGTTVTWGSTSASIFNSIILELDGSQIKAIAATTTTTVAATMETTKAIVAATAATIALVAGRAYARAVAATSSLTAVLSRGISRAIGALSTLTAAITRAITYARAVAATSSLTAVLARGMTRSIAAASTLAAAITRAITGSVSVGLTATAVLGRATGKLVASTVSVTAGLARVLAYSLVVAVTSAVSAVLDAVKQAGSHVYNQAVDVTATFVAALGRTVGKLIAAPAGVGATISRVIAKEVSPVLSAAAALTRRMARAIGATSPTTGAITRRVAKLAAATTTLTAALSIGAGKLVAAAAGLTASATRATTKAVAPALSAVVTFTRGMAREIAVATAVAAATPQTYRASSTSTSNSFTLPSGTQTGDLMVAFVLGAGRDLDPGAASCSGWTLVASGVDSIDDGYYATWYTRMTVLTRVKQAGDTGPWTFVNGTSGGIASYYGGDGTVGASDGGAGLPRSLTTTGGDDRLLYAVGATDSTAVGGLTGTWAPPASWTEDVDYVGTYRAYTLDEVLKSAAGATGSIYGSAPAGTWVSYASVVVELNPTAAGGGGEGLVLSAAVALTRGIARAIAATTAITGIISRGAGKLVAATSTLGGTVAKAAAHASGVAVALPVSAVLQTRAALSKLIGLTVTLGTAIQRGVAKLLAAALPVVGTVAKAAAHGIAVAAISAIAAALATVKHAGTTAYEQAVDAATAIAAGLSRGTALTLGAVPVAAAGLARGITKTLAITSTIVATAARAVGWARSVSASIVNTVTITTLKARSVTVAALSAIGVVLGNHVGKLVAGAVGSSVDLRRGLTKTLAINATLALGITRRTTRAIAAGFSVAAALAAGAIRRALVAAETAIGSALEAVYHVGLHQYEIAVAIGVAFAAGLTRSFAKVIALGVSILARLGRFAGRASQTQHDIAVGRPFTRWDIGALSVGDPDPWSVAPPGVRWKVGEPTR